MEEQAKKKAAESAVELVPSAVRADLLALVGDRLSAGEPLISHGHFHKAMEEGYHALRGTFPSEGIKERLGEIAREVVAANPETFAVPGVENWITRVVLGSVRKKSGAFPTCRSKCRESCAILLSRSRCARS